MFASIAIQLGVAWGLGYVNSHIINRPRRPAAPRPDDSDFPITKVGTPIPLVYGTVKIENPILAWAGLFSPTVQSVGINKYSASALFILGTPPSKNLPAPAWGAPFLRRVWIGDRHVDVSLLPGGILTHGNNREINVDLGGLGNGGRAIGFIEFFDGRPDQLITTYPGVDTSLMKKIDKAFFQTGSNVDRSLVPGYRNQMLLAVLCDKQSVSSQATYGESSSFPAVAAEVTCVDGDAINASGGTDANPAWVIYDLVCGYVFKLGYSTTLVDDTSFAAMAAILVTEAHGCSVYLPSEDDIENIINSLLAQIDGVLYYDEADDLIKLRLIRSDYDVDDIREMNIDNTMARPEVTETGWPENGNHFDVEFTHRAKQYKTDSISSKRLANAVRQNYRSRPRTIRYPYCMDPALASKLAARNAAIAGRPLMTATAILDRSFYNVTLGEPLKANWPQINVTDKVFRVLDIDAGQLGADTVKVTLIEDVFDNAFGAIEPPSGSPPDVDVLPVLSRIFEEAPRWLEQLAYFQGWVGDPNVPRILNAARREPEQLADAFVGQTRADADPFATDVAAQSMPFTARVATAYPATASPYDTATGLVMELVTGPATFAPSDYTKTATQVRGGANLIAVGTVIDHVMRDAELMAFESITDLGGGQYRLNRVWRELHDTASDDHPIGDHVVFLDYPHVGQRDWTRGAQIIGKSQPVPTLFTGTAPVDAEDPMTFRGDVNTGDVSRIELALRGADFCVNAIETPLVGTTGIPAPVVSYKNLSVFEGSLDAIWKQRDETASSVVRGDDASGTVQGGALWRFYARKVGEAESLIQGPLTNVSVSTVGLLLGKAGHGEIDVLLRTDGTWGPSWQDARCRVSAHRARNLLGNAAAQYVALAPWTNATGTSQIIQDFTSLEQTGNGRFFRALTDSSNVTVLEQVVDVSGYKPSGLRARVVWYTRNYSSDTDDTSAVQLISGATDSTSSPVIGPTDHWRRAEHSIDIPQGETSVTVRIIMTGVTNATSHANVGGVALYIEQASDELLDNPSFDTDGTDDWTNVTNSFSVDVAVNIAGYASRDGGEAEAAQGGTFANAEIKQEQAVPAGFEHGDAVLRWAQANDLEDDTGEVILEAVDGGGFVIGSVTTGSVAYTVATGWVRQRLVLPLPDGTVMLRVRLRATRTLGSGFCGAAFDDFSLRIHKDLDSVYERDLDFTAPVYALAPTTWQHFYLALPELSIPILWNGDDGLPSVRNSQLNASATAAWSDASTPTPARFVGHWEENRIDVASVDAYRFLRALAGSAIDLQVDGYGEFAKADPFSIAVLFRVTERSMSLACGLAGRRDNSGHGWGLSLNSSGQVVAAVQGSSARTATGSIDHRDGAAHWVLMTWDGSTLKVVDANGSATNGADPGEFAITGVPMRIGRAGVAEATGGIDIARVLVWDGVAVAEADFLDSIHRIGTDPNDQIDRETGWTSSDPVWVQGADDTIVRAATRHVPIARNGSEYALALVSANDNIAPSSDFANATYFAAETNATLTQGIDDPTGMLRGVRVTNSATGKGLLWKALPLGLAAADLNAVIWARSIDGPSRVVTVALYDSGDNLIDTDTITVTTVWQRFEINRAWTGATATGYLKLSLGAVTGTFDVAHVLWAGLDSYYPFAIQDAGVSIGDTCGVVAETVPIQFNREGELQAFGFHPEGASGVTFVSVDNDADENDKRRLGVSNVDGDVPGTKAARSTVWDDAATPVSVNLTVSWASSFNLRGRWNQLELPEQLGYYIATTPSDDPTSAEYYGTSFSASDTPSAKIHLGGGDPDGSTSPNALLSRVVVRAREQKLL